MNLPLIAALLRFDRRRPGLPGEHLAALGMGASLLRSARQRPTRLGRLFAYAAGAALVWRAASGRDGLRKVLPRAR